VAYDEIIYPSNANKTVQYEAVFDAKEFIESSRNFEGPYGTLVDCEYLDHYLESADIVTDRPRSDYLTCLAVKHAVWSAGNTTTAHELSCGVHNCSCSAPTLKPSGEINTSSSNMTARIVLNNSSWELAPLLALEFTPGGLNWGWHAHEKPETPVREMHDLSNMIDFWSGRVLEIDNLRLQSIFTKVYVHGDSVFNTTTIKKESRCVVDDAYSWGFSSLLLLTFCCYTMAFALGLILLQTDVYWHSRHDRDHQSHSIYTDVLFLAEELKAAFGVDIKDHMQSPKLFRKRIEDTKEGVRLEVITLPLSRAEEANPYRLAFPPMGRIRRLIRREHRLVSTSHSEMAQSQEEDTELEMVEQTSAASSALSLQPEVVDTNIQGSGHEQ
jgi:hypothetical protein